MAIRLQAGTGTPRRCSPGFHHSDYLAVAPHTPPCQIPRRPLPRAFPSRLSTARTTRSLDYERDLGDPGQFPFTRGVQPTMYRGRLWTMRQYAGFGTAAETNRRFRLLLDAGQTGPERRVRPADADGHRLRFAARARRGRPRRRGDRYRRGHARAARRHSARQGLDVDDDQRHGVDAARDVHRRGRRAGHRARQAERHDPERHPQGVHRARHVHLSARAEPRADRRDLPLLRRRGAELESDLDLRLPHSRGRRDGGAGAGVHVRQRDRVRQRAQSTPASSVDAFAPRLSFFFAAHNDLFEEVAKFRAARRHVRAPHARALRRRTTRAAGCASTRRPAA